MLLPVTCAVCGRAGGVAVCPACADQLHPPPADAASSALFAYVGTGQALLAGLKFRSRRGPVPMLGAALAARVIEAGASPLVVTWPPTGGVRRRSRGFDQAELLARATARALGLPARRLLVRIGGPPQTGQGRAARLAGPTFVALGRVPGRVLVVDDVVTTGATLRAARAALLAGGAHRVDTFALAATPDRDVRHDVPAA